MKCQSLFSGEKKMSSAEFTQKVVKIKKTHSGRTEGNFC